MLKKLINIFFPPQCKGCSKPLLTQENTICITCRHEIPKTNHLQFTDNECFKKFYGRIPLEHASAMLYYHKKGIVQQLIHQLKYKNCQKIGTILGEWYAHDLYNSKKLDTIDVIIPVPLHQKRQKERGYNQITTFGEALAKGLSKKLDATILKRKKHTATQSKKDRIHRNTVCQDTFEVQNYSQHHNKHFLLIDDVLTTGATLEACGKALLKIPGAKISIVTIAMSQS